MKQNNTKPLATEDNLANDLKIGKYLIDFEADT